MDAVPLVEQPGLWLDEKGLGLLMPGLSTPFRLPVGQLTRRLQKPSELVRACGLKPGDSKLTVLEPFAGFALDSLGMAAAGARVIGYERHPLVYHMARDIVARSGLDVLLQLGDGVSTLAQAVNRYDVVYLDPMFEPRNKKALPGLGAQILRELNFTTQVDSAPSTHSAPPIEDYLTQGLMIAPRVVLKSPLKQRVYGKPNHTLRGRTVRFDVYVGSAGT